jgi:hypothetical protein
MSLLRAPRWALALLLASCVDKSPPPPPVDPALVAENLLSAPPADLTQRVDATFGGGVVYLGNTVELAHPGPVVPGDKLTIVHYWQVNQAPPKGYRVFSHLTGDRGDFANVDLTDMRKGHPPDTWRPGEVIRDRQTFILRKDWKSPKLALSVGLYQKGSAKVSDRLAVTGAPSKDGAVTVATFEVDVAQPTGPIAKRAVGAIVVDGKATEPAWREALSTAGFQTAEGSPEPNGPTAAKLTWDDQHLYVYVSATDNDVASSYTATDEPIWKADVIELFIDADGNGKGYVELQVSPKNVQFDTWYAIGRPNDDKSYSAAMTTAVEVRGTLNSGSLDDQGWDAEFAIPWAAVKGNDPTMAVRLPPQPGDTMRLNVVRVDYPAGGSPSASAWNRIRYTDFHSIDRLMTITFGDPAGGIKPAAEVPAPGTAPAPAPGTAPAPAPGTAPAPAPGQVPGIAPVSGKATLAPAGTAPAVVTPTPSAPPTP